jgi:xanthine/CO dehydrogenase XdhC/CoxF family maturation factor
LIDAFFAGERDAGRPLVAAWVIATEGSTYRKAGALMLFSSQGGRCGLLSGGCLEGDLQEHASRLLSEGSRLTTRSYDSRGSDDPIWGLGLGCEGLMRMLLLRQDAADGYEPLEFLLSRATTRTRGTCAIVVSVEPADPAAAALWPGTHWTWAEHEAQATALPEPVLTRCRARAASGVAGIEWLQLGDQRAEVFFAPVARRPALLLCGAGPDAEPVAALAAQMGWQVSVVDHRPAYIARERFAAAADLRLVEADRLGELLDLDLYDAAVVMSHHLVADGHYLGQLAGSRIGYVGLLGPAARRERLYAELGPRADALRPRLRAPVGLDLGGRTPEAIALSIVAEIQAVLNGRRGLPFSG